MGCRQPLVGLGFVGFDTAFDGSGACAGASNAVVLPMETMECGFVCS